LHLLSWAIKPLIPNINIAGIILNKVGGSRHEEKLCNVIEHYTDLSVVGSVHNAPELEIDERHLGLKPSNESTEALEKIELLGETVARQVNLDKILSIAEASPTPAAPVTEKPIYTGERVRIGYPKDRAFGFYYPGDEEKLIAAGADLVPFDSLSDPKLPDVDGLMIGGGFPEMVMHELEANQSLRQDILQFIEAGGPVYAECGGLMYLARSLTWNGKTCQMVGAIAGDIDMHKKPQGRGYVKLIETGKSPWPTCGCVPEPHIAGHEFHYSALNNLDPNMEFAYRVTRGTGIDGEHDGLVYKNLLASYTHLRNVGGNCWTDRFIDHIKSVKQHSGY